MQRSYRQPFFIAIVLHSLIFLLLALGFQITGKNFVFENDHSAPIVNAMVMNIPAPHKQEVKPAPKPVVPPQPAPPPIEKQPIKPAPIVKTQENNVINIKKQKEIRQKELEKQLLADLKKTKFQQKNIKQKSLEEAFAQELKNLSAQKKQAQKEAERVENEREQNSQGEIDKYKALVLQVIGRHWIIPGNVNKNLATKLVIYLSSSGNVLDVEIFESSGNPALDSSARAAVFKASPLPVPPDPERFKFFKRFVLVFRPIYFQNYSKMGD